MASSWIGKMTYVGGKVVGVFEFENGDDKRLHVLPLHVMHICNRSDSRVSAVRGSSYLPHPLP
jgi:hypothetical protein